MSQNSSSISWISLSAEGMNTSHFRVFMGVRWIVCSCISRYILLWCHIVCTPVNAIFMRLNSKTKWKGKGGSWGRRQRKPQNPRLNDVSCFTRLFTASDSTWPELYLSLFVTLTVLLSRFFFCSHMSLHVILLQQHTQMQDNWLVMHQKVFVLFFSLFGSG